MLTNSSNFLFLLYSIRLLWNCLLVKYSLSVEPCDTLLAGGVVGVKKVSGDKIRLLDGVTCNTTCRLHEHRQGDI